jgi:hypothetical protein
MKIIAELTEFETVNTRLADLIGRRAQVEADLAKATAELGAAERAKVEAVAALSEEDGENRLGGTVQALTAIRARIVELEAKAADYAAGIAAVKPRVIAAEEAARRALIEHWNGAEQAAKADALRALPPLARLFWAWSGALGGTGNWHAFFIGGQVWNLLGFTPEALEQYRPAAPPLTAPESRHVEERERQQMRREAQGARSAA